jgi:hypothetical protein
MVIGHTHWLFDFEYMTQFGTDPRVFDDPDIGFG